MKQEKWKLCDSCSTPEPGAFQIGDSWSKRSSAFDLIRCGFYNSSLVLEWPDFGKLSTSWRCAATNRKVTHCSLSPTSQWLGKGLPAREHTPAPACLVTWFCEHQVPFREVAVHLCLLADRHEGLGLEPNFSCGGLCSPNCRWQEVSAPLSWGGPWLAKGSLSCTCERPTPAKGYETYIKHNLLLKQLSAILEAMCWGCRGVLLCDECTLHPVLLKRQKWANSWYWRDPTCHLVYPPRCHYCCHRSVRLCLPSPASHEASREEDCAFPVHCWTSF